MNPYLYLFRKYFNGYMIIVIILVFCYFIRVRNIYTMEHYKSIIKTTEKGKGEKKNVNKTVKKKGKKKVKEGFVSTPTVPSKQHNIPKSKLQNLQPYYETKLDRIYKKIEDRYDNNEHKLVNDYNKAYMDYLEEEKEKEMNINPIQALTNFEESIYAMIDGKGESESNSVYARRVHAGNIGSYFDKDDIPAKGDDLTKTMSRDTPSVPKKIKNEPIIEGFASEDDSSIKKLKRKNERSRPIKPKRGIRIQVLP